MKGGGLVVGVAGLAVPVLAFAFVGREPEVAAVGEVELLVDVEDGLDAVVAGGERVEVGEWVADGFGVDDDGLAGGEVFYVDAEGLGGLVVFAELEAGFVVAAAAAAGCSLGFAMTRIRWPFSGAVAGTVTSKRSWAGATNVANSRADRVRVRRMESVYMRGCGYLDWKSSGVKWIRLSCQTIQEWTPGVWT